MRHGADDVAKPFRLVHIPLLSSCILTPLLVATHSSTDFLKFGCMCQDHSFFPDIDQHPLYVRVCVRVCVCVCVCFLTKSQTKVSTTQRRATECQGSRELLKVTSIGSRFNCKATITLLTRIVPQSNLCGPYLFPPLPLQRLKERKLVSLCKLSVLALATYITLLTRLACPGNPKQSYH